MEGGLPNNACKIVSISCLKLARYSLRFIVYGLNPQTGLLNPGGYTTRFGPATPRNNFQDILWGVLMSTGLFYMFCDICGGDYPEYLRGYEAARVIKPVRHGPNK